MMNSVARKFAAAALAAATLASCALPVTEAQACGRRGEASLSVTASIGGNLIEQRAAKCRTLKDHVNGAIESEMPASTIEAIALQARAACETV